MDDDTDDEFEHLLEYLREERGFDFGGYKRQSLMRRVRRQMAMVEIASFSDYQDYLALHPDEFSVLFNTVLINVTSFFRDADSWDYLRREIAPALASRGQTPIRVWSAGCSTGEEAYSVAMLLYSELGPDQFRERVKIYATDVDEVALAKARTATYAARELRGLDEQQVAEFFESTTNGQHTIRKDIRRSVIFGRNDLVQDAPISHIDLLVCRNALMYFNAETQGRIIRRLHFALRPSGTLFLGKAEMLLSHVELFTPIDLKRRFFRKASDGVPERRTPAVPGREHGDHSADVARLRDEALLSAPAAQVVVAATGELVASNRRAEAMFGILPRDVGRPFQDLEVSYRPLELRSSIESAMAERRSVWEHDVELQRPGVDTLSLDVQVMPLIGPDSEPLGATVIFNDVTRYRHLQQELQFANRQLEGAYEELQSTNEELETMNEELQSMNDELNASNEELRLRTVQVGELNHLMEAVLSSLRAGVSVIDRGMTVLAWNSGATELWGLREDEAVGRSLADLDIGMPVGPLLPLITQKLSTVSPDLAVRIPAVNRRGRAVEVDVTVSSLHRGDEEPAGTILVMILASE